jgi:hypothetical protein
VYEVRIFHGIARFYMKFIKNFSQLCALIIETINKNRQSFKWTIATDQNLLILKKTITEKPVLSFPYFNKFFQVETDVSGTAIGVVLS